jgi:hypothetical protein
MGRSFLLAVAVTLCLLGLECLVIQRATLTLQAPAPSATSPYDYNYLDPSLAVPATIEGARRIIEPPEWAPFGLLSAGIVLLLYSKSISSGG